MKDFGVKNINGTKTDTTLEDYRRNYMVTIAPESNSVKKKTRLFLMYGDRIISFLGNVVFSCLESVGGTLRDPGGDA